MIIRIGHGAWAGTRINITTGASPGTSTMTTTTKKRFSYAMTRSRVHVTTLSDKNTKIIVKFQRAIYEDTPQHSLSNLLDYRFVHRKARIWYSTRFII